MNRKLRCIIVDDEPSAVKLMKAYVNKINYLELVGSYDDAAKALSCIEKEDFDILFTDVQMPGINGLDMVKALPNPPVVIFVSAHRDYALDGFETNAIDYLMKPVTFERFEKSVDKARNFIRFKFESEQNRISDDHFLFVKSNNSYLKILFDDIVYIQAKGDYVSIFTAEKKDLLWRIKMSELENKLNPNQFIRVHKSYIVNVNMIHLLHQNHIELIDKIEVPLSKTYKIELNKRLGIH